MNPETIQAITPLFLGAIGGIVGIAAMFAPSMSDVSRAAGFGFASTAIGTAGGLSQSKNSESANIQGRSVSIQSVQGKEPGS